MQDAITGRLGDIECAASLVGEWQTPIGVWKDVAIERNGIVVDGFYCVSDWMITVKIKEGGNKSARLGDDAPATLAKSLLHELAQTL